MAVGCPPTSTTSRLSTFLRAFSTCRIWDRCSGFRSFLIAPSLKPIRAAMLTLGFFPYCGGRVVRGGWGGKPDEGRMRGVR